MCCKYPSDEKLWLFSKLSSGAVQPPVVLQLAFNTVLLFDMSDTASMPLEEQDDLDDLFIAETIGRLRRAYMVNLSSMK